MVSGNKIDNFSWVMCQFLNGLWGFLKYVLDNNAFFWYLLNTMDYHSLLCILSLSFSSLFLCISTSATTSIFISLTLSLPAAQTSSMETSLETGSIVNFSFSQIFISNHPSPWSPLKVLNGTSCLSEALTLMQTDVKNRSALPLWQLDCQDHVLYINVKWCFFLFPACFSFSISLSGSGKSGECSKQNVRCVINSDMDDRKKKKKL